MTNMRRESDSLGVVEVPADKLWGAQTQRSLEHFSIGSDLRQGLLYPLQSNILETEIQTAARVAKLVFDSKLARVNRPRDMVALIREHVYTPEYGKQTSTAGRGLRATHSTKGVAEDTTGSLAQHRH